MNNILLIHRSLGIGGAEKIIAFLANSLVPENNVTLLLLDNQDVTIKLAPEIHLVQESCYYNMPIISKKFFHGFHEMTKMIRCINKHIKAAEPQIIICFDLRIMLGVFFAKKNKAKVLLSERADPYQNTRYWQSLLKRIYKRANYIVFQTEGAQRFYGDIVKNKSKIIPNPAFPRITGDNDNNVTLDKKYIFSAGRFQHRKGFDILIRAFAMFAEDYSDYQLLLFGKGEMEMELHSLVDNLGITDRVVFLQPINGVVEKNVNATLFVLPSRSEGIPNIMLEAMAAEIPVVATDCSPGGAKMLSNGGEYCLLAKNDDVQSLYSCIKFSIEHKEESKNKVLQAKKSLIRFEPSIISAQWKSVIDALMEEGDQ